MKKIVLLMSVIALMVSCKSGSEQGSTVDNSRDSLDWAGTYIGTLPCADCEGIDYSLLINSDGTYQLTRTYLVTPEANYSSNGTFAWNDKGSEITLNGMENEGKFIFKVGENKLTYLDQDGKEITGDLAKNYILEKVDLTKLAKKWRLVELMGNPIVTPEGAKEPFLELKEDGKAHGNFGCNSFHGSYTVRLGDRIHFSQMASTMMMCLNMETEQKFSEVLRMTDNYNLVDNKLVLNRARMAPLARFEAMEE